MLRLTGGSACSRQPGTEPDLHGAGVSIAPTVSDYLAHSNLAVMGIGRWVLETCTDPGHDQPMHTICGAVRVDAYHILANANDQFLTEAPASGVRVSGETARQHGFSCVLE